MAGSSLSPRRSRLCPMEPILAPPSSAQETSTVRRRLLAGSIGALLALAACGGGAPPSVEVLQEAVSPDGRHVATAFYCEGGGAAGYTFHNVTLQPSGEELDPMAGLLGKHPTWHSFGGIELRWQDAANLEVSYHARAADDEQRLTRVGERYGITIHYILRP